MQVARKVADSIGLPHDGLVLQSVPTPRILRPETHGSSFHCDYWYGHGLSTYTTWLQLTPVEMGDSPFICAEACQEALFEKLVSTRKFNEFEDELLAFLFHSKVLHGSPKNTSSKTRVSFDFRIGSKSEKMSTKDLAN